MRRILCITLLVLVAAGLAVAKESVYGKGLTEGEFTSVAKILAEPDAYVGQVVRVEGVVVGVCVHRGCWLNIASEQEGETLRFKVQDGVIVFPKEILGETVRAEGVFTKNVVEKACAEESGDGPAEKCVTFYQVSGTGAVVDWK
jgi:hypothetical protein